MIERNANQPQTLHTRAAGWAQRFCARVQGEWIAEEIEGLHQQLDDLVIEADARGEEALSKAALELSSVLSAFIGLVRAPSPAQLRSLLELTDAMIFAAAEDREPPDIDSVIAPESSVAPDLDASADDRSRAVAWCVSGNPALVARARAAFRQQGLPFAALPPTLGWTEALPESGVQCVIVDADSLGVLLDLQRRAPAAAGAGHASRPTCVAVLQDASTSERVRALRAGADHVVRDTDDAVALADKLAKILAARHDETLSVLVIDDDPGQTLFCTSILRRFGVQTDHANDAGTALAALHQQMPDVVLVDLHMPEMDGLELTERLLELPGSEFVSVLFLSGDDEPDTRFDALTAGADDYLSKPIQPRHLIRAVLAHGRHSQRRRRAAARGR